MLSIKNDTQKKYDEVNIESVIQLNKGEIIDIFYFGNLIKENCLILKTIQDQYYEKGLIIYLNGIVKETIDLENQEGLWIKKIKY
tara:strand:+ start:731 stop:985 length:255 start_codon:yes stop_codon:yes gene_type:complete